MSKVLILDPSCVSDNRSHNINAVMGHARTFISAGYDVILGTNMECKMENNGYRNHAVFSYTIYDDHRNRRTGLFKRWLSRNYYRNLVNETTEMVRKILDNCNISSNDHVFVPTTDWILFQSLLNLHSVNEKSPFLHFLLMYEDGYWMTGGYPYARIVRKLETSGKLNKKIFIYTETDKHSKNMSARLGFRPPKYPYPSFPVSSECRKPVSDKTIHIGALGGGRRDKGFALLPVIISEFNRKCSNTRNVVFLIQKPRPEDNLNREVDLLERISNVQLLDNYLTRDNYYRYLNSCDICIFPYTTVYSTRGSGLVNEAVSNNIPIVCSENTALTEAITHNNGKSANMPMEFPDAIIDIIKNLDAYNASALKAGTEFNNKLYKNPVIENIRKLS